MPPSSEVSLTENPASNSLISSSEKIPSRIYLIDKIQIQIPQIEILIVSALSKKN